jgi:hypothetical protein
MNLITLEEYKSFNAITKTDQDFKITLLLSVVSRLIKNHVRTSIIDNWTVPIVETAELGYESNIIFTKQFPIREIISVTEIPYAVGIYNDSTIHVPLTFMTDYVLEENKVIRLNGIWNPRPDSVIITYTSGYATTPDDIKYATILLVEYYLKEQYIHTRSMMGSSLQSYDTMGTELPPHIARILDHYLG